MHPYDLTPGVLDPSAEGAFMGGACGALALVLADATGWPLVALTDAHNVHDGRVGGGSCLHYGARRPGDGAFVDVRGAHTDDDILEEFGDDADDGEAAIGLTSEVDVREWYVHAQGEPVPLTVARTFVDAVLERARAADR